jgi:hypothetical protein
MQGARILEIRCQGGLPRKNAVVGLVAGALWQYADKRVIVINLDPEIEPAETDVKAASAKALRLQSIGSWGGVPYVDRGRIKNFLNELAAKKLEDSLDGYAIAVLGAEGISSERLQATGRVLFLSAGDSSAGPWFYSLLGGKNASRKPGGLGVAIVHEPLIENAAGIYLRLIKELREAIGQDPGLDFFGCLGFDPDHAALADACGFSIFEMFNGRQEHGQAKDICRRVLDGSESLAYSSVDETIAILREYSTQ